MWRVEPCLKAGFYIIMRIKTFCIIALIAYVIVTFNFAVFNREPMTTAVTRLVLFQGYVQPVDNSYRDIFLNIVGFIPIGMLFVLISKNYRILKALLFGMLLSLTIEISQLFWKRGTFDVDDLFNNAIGALVGGVIAVAVVKTWKGL